MTERNSRRRKFEAHISNMKPTGKREYIGTDRMEEKKNKNSDPKSVCAAGIRISGKIRVVGRSGSQ
jgi:hypothetical protein